MDPRATAETETEQSRLYLAGKDIHEQWETDYLNPELDPFYEEALARVVALLGAKPGETILDAGCGYCFHAARLAQHGLKVTGVDFSEAALAQARRFLASKGMAGAIELRQGDLLKLPFEDNSFEFVNCWGVLMHIPQLETALRELVRVLRPGGRLALTENNANSLHVRVWEPSLRAIKRVIGRKQGAGASVVRHGRTGKEEWYGEQDAGGLLVRKTDMSWLEQEMRGLGAELRHREAGQFTEVYTSLPWPFAKRLVYGFNRFWFRSVRAARPAMGNILVFEKVGATPPPSI